MPFLMHADALYNRKFFLDVTKFSIKHCLNIIEVELLLILLENALLLELECLIEIQ